MSIDPYTSTSVAEFVGFVPVTLKVVDAGVLSSLPPSPHPETNSEMSKKEITLANNSLSLSLSLSKEIFDNCYHCNALC